MKKYILALILILLIILGFYIYKLTTYTYIEAKFKELRPIHNRLDVYYKGIVIGKAREIHHSDSFEHTIMKIVLYPKKLLLPDNSEVYLKKEKFNNKEKDFLELIYPKEPSKTMIANGATINGIATLDVEVEMRNQHPDDIENLKQNLANSVQSLSYAMDGLNEMFGIINGILLENKPNLYSTTKGFSNVSTKIDNSLDKNKLNNVVSNIDSSFNNINLALESTPQTLEDTKGLMNNLNTISCGIRKTLGKTGGGLRLFFGKVIQ